MKKNRKALGKLMAEFSQELGIPSPKGNGGMGKKILMAAGSLAGFYMIRGIINKMK